MRSSWLRSAGAVTLHAVVEAAWITVFYAAIQAVLLGQRPQLGVLHIAVAAALGMVLARHRQAGRPAVWLAVVAVVALIGCAGDPVAFAALVSLDPMRALAVHGGGLLAGLAVLRGGRYARLEDDQYVLAGLLERGIPSLAVPWLLAATMAPGPERTAFDEGAFLGTVLFVGLGTAALGLARLRAMGIEPQIGEAGGTAWLAVIFTGPLAVLMAAVPIAAWLRISPQALAEDLLRPLSGALATAAALLALPFGIAAEALTRLLGALGLKPGSSSSPGGGGSPGLPSEQGGRPDPAAFETLVGTGLLLLAGAVLVILIVIWARGLMAGVGRPAIAVREERRIVMPRVALPRRARQQVVRRRPQGRPSDAVGAYLATLHGLEEDGDLARRPAETPAAHQRRVTERQPDLAPLRWLAIDYQLARYAGRRITSREDARAVRRWGLMRAAAEHRRRARGLTPFRSPPGEC